MGVGGQEGVPVARVQRFLLDGWAGQGLGASQAVHGRSRLLVLGHVAVQVGLLKSTQHGQVGNRHRSNSKYEVNSSSNNDKHFLLTLAEAL